MLIKKYGILEEFAAYSEFDEALCELSINGFTTLKSNINKATCASLNSKLQNLYSIQTAEFPGELQAINDENIVRCPLAYETDFLQVATDKYLMDFSKKLFGNNFVLLMQNGLLNQGGITHAQTAWHRDLNYQHWTSSRPLAINALFCSTDFTLRNGATHLLSGTHAHEKFPTDQFVDKYETQVCVTAGTFLILNANLFHRAGLNKTRNTRYAINHVIGLPFMAQQVSIPDAIQTQNKLDSTSLTPDIRRYLGFEWAPAASPLDWRLQKLRVQNQ